MRRDPFSALTLVPLILGVDLKTSHGNNGKAHSIARHKCNDWSRRIAHRSAPAFMNPSFWVGVRERTSGATSYISPNKCSSSVPSFIFEVESDEGRYCEYENNNKSDPNITNEFYREGFFVALRCMTSFGTPLIINPTDEAKYKKKRQQHQGELESNEVKNGTNKQTRAQNIQRIENEKILSIVTDAINLHHKQNQKEKLQEQMQRQKDINDQQEEPLDMDILVEKGDENESEVRDNTNHTLFKIESKEALNSTIGNVAVEAPTNWMRMMVINSTEIQGVFNKFFRRDATAAPRHNRSTYGEANDVESIENIDLMNSITMNNDEKNAILSDEKNNTFDNHTVQQSRSENQLPPLSTTTELTMTPKTAKSTISTSAIAKMETRLRRSAAATKNLDEQRKLLAYLKAWKVKLEVDERIDLLNEILMDSWYVDQGKKGIPDS